MSIKEIIMICKGYLYCGDENIYCDSFTKDTRTLNKGDTYIGIKGEKFDGNAFYEEAISKGAKAIILEEDYLLQNSLPKENIPIIVVKNSLEALKNLAIYKRNKSKAKFIAVTGSVGKTSTKDMIYSVLNTSYKTLKTLGNNNNNIGLPLTMLRLKDEEAAVIEMGMNHLGEIDYLAKIVKPHIGVITNVGTAHIGNLGSRKNILKAKLEIKNGLTNDGILVINNDNDLLHDYFLNNKENIITIGINNPSDVMATDIKLEKDYSTFNILYKEEKYPVKCLVPGEVFVYNSLISFAVGVKLNIPYDKIIMGIKNFALTENRMEYLKLPDNTTIINDAYNASVDSMKSSLAILSKYSNRKIAVLGNMLELGSFSKELHEQVGHYVLDNKIDILITVGDMAKYISDITKDKIETYQLNSNDEAIALLKKIMHKDDIILFKASNAMHFKEIIANLQKER